MAKIEIPDKMYDKLLEISKELNVQDNESEICNLFDLFVVVKSSSMQLIQEFLKQLTVKK